MSGEPAQTPAVDPILRAFAARDAADEPWPEPLDLFGDPVLTGEPVLRPEHLPEAISGFVFDTAARMGADPAAVALAALVSLSAVADDAFTIQPKRHDDTWTESPRLWGGIVGPPSILKSPVIAACTRPLDHLEAEARERHAEDMRRFKADHAAWKKDGGEPAAEPRQPRVPRFLAESSTIEAIAELLRDDPDARFSTPAGKVLVRQDELSEWVANLDRYRAGGRGGGDRGSYLRAFNGGRFVVDRVGRGSFAIPNWSLCLLGGIQPDPLRRIATESADDGLLARFLLVVPARQERGEDRPPNRAAADRYSALFPALAALHPRAPRAGEDRRPLAFHADAHAQRERINDLVAAVSALPDTSPRTAGALGKWPGIFARLALLYQLIETADRRVRGDDVSPMSPVIPVTLATQVAELMANVLLPHLMKAEAAISASPQTGHAAWIAGLILARGFTRIAARDITRAYRPLRAPEQRRELHDVMGGLEIAGWVRPEPSANPASPPTAWAVNPLVFLHFAARARQEREARVKAQAEASALIRSKIMGRS